MIVKRYASFFNKPNLNYEALLRRVQQFHRLDSHPPHMIEDYILANRTLQAINKRLDPQYKFSATRRRLDLVLNVASSDLEQELWDFLTKYWSQVIANDHVVRAYVLTYSGTDLSRAIELVKANYYHHQKSSLTLGGLHAKSELVSLLLRQLLRRNDYQNYFQLLDMTIASVDTLTRRRQIVSRVFCAGAGLVAAALAARLFLSSVGISPIWPDLLLLISGPALLSSFSFLLVKLLDLPRVSWRPHTGILYRFTHHGEMVNVNLLVTHFEENHEINVKNFHVSRVRSWAMNNSFQENDYELILPTPQGLQLARPQVEGIDKHNESTLQYVRSELLQRKMLWNPLEEEKMFLQFWLNHGENFEWAEPDQDPAEMNILRQK